MNLMQAVIEQGKSGPGPKCRFVALYARLTPDEAGELRTILARRDDFQNAQLFRAMRSQGWDMPVSTLARHRKGDCTCGTL